MSTIIDIISGVKADPACRFSLYAHAPSASRGDPEQLFEQAVEKYAGLENRQINQGGCLYQPGTQKYSSYTAACGGDPGDGVSKGEKRSSPLGPHRGTYPDGGK